MAYITSTFTALTGKKGCFSGILACINEDWSAGQRIPFPPNCAALESRPSGENYLNRQYLVGGHNRNLVIDEMLRASVQGILPPPKPSVSAGAGAIAQIGYLRFYDEITGERSSLSPGTSFTGTVSRTWTSLPTFAPGEIIVIDGTANIELGTVTGTATNFHDLRPGDRIAVSTDLTRWAQVETIISSLSLTIDDSVMAGNGVSLVTKPFSRVSHVELWVSVGGALPRFILRVRIGTTTVSESVATLALGESFIDSYEPMPKGTYNVIYNSRQIVAGVAGQRDRVFVSLIGFPERYGGLNFQTKYGEPIVGLVRTRDYVIVLCPKSSYRLQGWTEDDYVLVGLEAEIGGLGHGGNAVCGGKIFIPSREQIQMFDGSFSPANPTRRSEWSRGVRTFEDAYQSGVAIVDPENQNYRFLPFPLRMSGIGSEIPSPPVPPTTGCPAVWLGGCQEIITECFYLPYQNETFDDLSFLYFSKSHTPSLRRQQYTPATDRDFVYFPSGVAGHGYAAGYNATHILLKTFDRRGVPTLLASVPKSFAGARPVAGTVYQGNPYIFVGDEGGKVDGTSKMRVYKYAGGALTEEPIDPDADFSRPGQCTVGYFATLGNDLYFVTDHINNDADPLGLSPPNVFRLSGGSWTTIAPSWTWFQETEFQRSSVLGMAAFGGAIYVLTVVVSNIPGQSGYSFIKIVGSTITFERLLPLNGAYGFGAFVFNGYLYYFWSPTGIPPGYLGTPPYILARFDGVTWEDNHKDLCTQFGLGPGTGELYFWGAADGALHVVIADWKVEPCIFNVYSSPGVDTGGTWIASDMFHYNPVADDPLLISLHPGIRGGVF